MLRVPQVTGLVKELVELLKAHRGAFGQERVYERVVALVMGEMVVWRGWQGVTNANNGLYQPATGPATALHPYSDDAHAGVEDYKYLKTLGYPSFRDATTGGYYIFNGSVFWSFDDVTNITNKMQYIKSKGLGGVMAWALDGDSNGELMKAAAAGLR